MPFALGGFKPPSLSVSGHVPGAGGMGGMNSALAALEKRQADSPDGANAEKPSSGSKQQQSRPKLRLPDTNSGSKDSFEDVVHSLYLFGVPWHWQNKGVKSRVGGTTKEKSMANVFAAMSQPGSNKRSRQWEADMFTNTKSNSHDVQILQVEWPNVSDICIGGGYPSFGCILLRSGQVFNWGVTVLPEEHEKANFLSPSHKMSPVLNEQSLTQRNSKQRLITVSEKMQSDDDMGTIDEDHFVAKNEKRSQDLDAIELDIQSKSLEPSLVESLLGVHVTQISCGAFHAAAISSSRDVYVWGAGAHGQLGNSSVSDLLVPMKLDELSGKCASVSLGAEHSVFLTNDNKVFSCGKNSDGQLGIGSTSAMCTSLQLVQSLMTSKVVKISAGGWHTLAVAESSVAEVHEVYSWGSNEMGQLGRGESFKETYDASPKMISNIGSCKVCHVSSGRQHCCMVVLLDNPLGGNGMGSTPPDSSICVWTWGCGIHGRLGNGSLRGSFPAPVKLRSLTAELNQQCRHFGEDPADYVDSVKCGSRSTALVLITGAIYAFGMLPEEAMKNCRPLGDEKHPMDEQESVLEQLQQDSPSVLGNASFLQTRKLGPIDAFSESQPNLSNASGGGANSSPDSNRSGPGAPPMLGSLKRGKSILLPKGLKLLPKQSLQSLHHGTNSNSSPVGTSPGSNGFQPSSGRGNSSGDTKYHSPSESSREKHGNMPICPVLRPVRLMVKMRRGASGHGTPLTPNGALSGSTPRQSSSLSATAAGDSWNALPDNSDITSTSVQVPGSYVECIAMGGSFSPIIACVRCHRDLPLRKKKQCRLNPSDELGGAKSLEEMASVAFPASMMAGNRLIGALYMYREEAIFFSKVFGFKSRKVLQYSSVTDVRRQGPCLQFTKSMKLIELTFNTTISADLAYASFMQFKARASPPSAGGGPLSRMINRSLSSPKSSMSSPGTPGGTKKLHVKSLQQFRHQSKMKLSKYAASLGAPTMTQSVAGGIGSMIAQSPAIGESSPATASSVTSIGVLSMQTDTPSTLGLVTDTESMGTCDSPSLRGMEASPSLQQANIYADGKGTSPGTGKGSMKDLELTRKDWKLLLQGAELNHYHGGETVLFEGAPVTKLFQVGRGTVLATKVVDGKEVILREMGAGEFFGEISFMTDGKATANILVGSDETAEVYSVDQAFISGLVVSNPQLAARWFKFLCTMLAKRLASAGPQAKGDQSQHGQAEHHDDDTPPVRSARQPTSAPQ